MIELLKALEPYIPLAISIVVLIIVVMVVRARKDMDVTLPGGANIKGKQASASVETATQAVGAVVERMQIRLDQYGEVATALSVVIEAGPSDVEAAAREWFSTLATRLAHLLREQGDHHHRVAIWLDGQDGGDFIGIGYGLFDKRDDNMERLERAYTIGGLAFKSITGDFYCRDTRTDSNFKPRKTVPPSFHSVHAIALGPINRPWGVMTVDARETNGFSDERRTGGRFMSGVRRDTPTRVADRDAVQRAHRVRLSLPCTAVAPPTRRDVMAEEWRVSHDDDRVAGRRGSDPTAASTAATHPTLCAVGCLIVPQCRA